MEITSTNNFPYRKSTVLLLLFIALKSHGQLVLNQPNTSGNYTAPQSITLSPGFSTAPGASFTATIKAVSVPIQQAFSSDQNYIATYTPRVEGLVNPSDPGNTIDQVMTSIQYFDGLGRQLQNVQVKASPNLKDIVQSFVYDQFGRPSIQYQPYVAVNLTADGSYKTGNPDDLIKAFYNPSNPGAPAIATTAFPYAETQYEASPLNRVLQQGAPGSDWQLSQGHTIRSAYSTNSANEVRIWNVTANGADGSTYYQPGTLYKYITTDENGNNTIEYKDLQQKTVLKQSQSDNGYISTYYVYDDFDNLRYVIPPVPQGVTFPSGFTESDAVFRNFIYGFHYDGRNRLIEKKMPAKGWEFSIYNKIDQVVMTQDSVQRSKSTQEWTITKMDGLGRIILSAIYSHPGSTAGTSYRQYMQGQVDGQAAQWDNRDDSSLGYNITTFPATWTTALTINYYDNYSFPGGNPYPYSGGSNMIHSLLTASRTKVLNSSTGTNDMLWMVNYYDDKGRIVKQFNQNYKGGTVNAGNYDEISNTYDFTDNITKTERKNYSAGSLAVTVTSEFEYDHVNRKTKVWETINNGTRTMLAQMNYNEVGQLIDKKLHSTDGVNFVQSVDYRYNERGWLKSINNSSLTNDNGITNDDTNDIYGQQITYNDHSEASKRLYNGNISAIAWQTKVPAGLGLWQGPQSFTYSFDKLSRLILADYTTAGLTGKFNETYTYDDLGNILNLTRKNNVSGYLNNYTYNYTTGGERSNKLSSVTDGGTAAENSSFGYDANGNMKADSRKNITIVYNHLNQPQTITQGGSQFVYTYDATGKKLRTVASGSVRDYVNGIEYNNGSIEFIQTTEGRAIPGSSYIYQYMLKDHLGSVKAVFSQDGSIVSVADYYAFGSDMPTGNGLISSPGNRYKFNGIEQNNELSIDNYDAFFRSLDPKIGRWTSLDPKPDYSVSPYAAMNNNPILHSDFLGDTIQVTFHTGFLGLGAKHTVTYNQGKLTENGVEYKGKVQGFGKATVAALDAIRTGGTEGAALISDLEKGALVNIASGSNTTSPDGKNVTFDPAGQGTDMPNQDGSTGRPAYVALAHELGHVWDFQNPVKGVASGTRAWYIASDKTIIRQGEKVATWWENKVRSENNIGLREYYSFIRDEANGGKWTPDPKGGILLVPGTRQSAVVDSKGKVLDPTLNSLPKSTGGAQY